jgi:putative transposase
MSDEKTMGDIIQIDEARIRDHLGEMVRGTVEETLNAMLDAEADQLCGAGRYERSQARADTRAGSYERTLHTKAGDGIVMKRSWAGEVRNVSLLVSSAVNSEGFREILGICEGAKEDKSGWSAFLQQLVDRGLNGVRLIISDACRGLIESIAEYLPEARWQRCMVHFYRNVFSHVPATKVRDVSHMLKAIHAQESREAADQKARAIIENLRASKMSTAANLVEQAVHETLTYYAFPDIHWQKIRTNNPLERIMREIRRRTRVVGAFPDGQSCLNLAAARLRYITGTAWSTKRYMNMRPLYQPQIMQTGTVA